MGRKRSNKASRHRHSKNLQIQIAIIQANFFLEISKRLISFFLECFLKVTGSISAFP
jgi:hypothetical protein